jgi:hypothetical protein
MSRQTTYPNCCALDIVYGFNTYGDNRIKRSQDRFGRPKGFIAVFAQHQENAFDVLCKQHKLTGVLRIKGQHGKDLALCHFLWEG